MSDKKLQVIPLGGLGEFGMHMMALRYADDIIVIDAGMMFPEAELLGVDIVTPDLTFLRENREHVRALLLTHGHEDHIGAVASSSPNSACRCTPPRSLFPWSNAASKNTRSKKNQRCAL